MSASLKVLWMEVILIALFGMLSVGLTWLVCEWGSSATPSLASSREVLELELNVPEMRGALTLIEQRLTALRAAAVESSVAARRHGSQAAAIEHRHPELGAPDPRGPVPPELREMASAFDEATIAASSNSAFEASLLHEIERLEKARYAGTATLLDRQRDVEDRFAARQRERDRARTALLLRRCGVGLAILAAVASLLAAVLAEAGRRRIAAVTVFIGVIGVGGTVFASRLAPALSAAFGAVIALAIVAIAVRTSR